MAKKKPKPPYAPDYQWAYPATEPATPKKATKSKNPKDWLGVLSKVYWAGPDIHKSDIENATKSLFKDAQHYADRQFWSWVPYKLLPSKERKRRDREGSRPELASDSRGYTAFQLTKIIQRVINAGGGKFTTPEPVGNASLNVKGLTPISSLDEGVAGKNFMLPEADIPQGQFTFKPGRYDPSAGPWDVSQMYRNMVQEGFPAENPIYQRSPMIGLPEEGFNVWGSPGEYHYGQMEQPVAASERAARWLGFDPINAQATVAENWGAGPEAVTQGALYRSTPTQVEFYPSLIPGQSARYAADYPEWNQSLWNFIQMIVNHLGIKRGGIDLVGGMGASRSPISSYVSITDYPASPSLPSSWNPTYPP